MQGDKDPWEDEIIFLGRPVLDLEGDSLRDADADSGWQDTVSADLPLCSIFHHGTKPACPGRKEHKD